MSATVVFNLDINADAARVFNFISDSQCRFLFKGIGRIPSVTNVVTSGPCAIGQTFRVEFSDGTTHEQLVVEFQSPKRYQTRLHRFVFPASLFIKEIIETWELQPNGETTSVQRSLELRFTDNMLSAMLGANVVVREVERVIGAHSKAVTDFFAVPAANPGIAGA